MKKNVKLAVLFSGILICSTAYSAEPPSVDKISKALVDSAKKSLLGEKGKFPLKLDGGMEIINITSTSNNVVFEYTVPTDSQSVPTENLTENIKVGLNNLFCGKQDMVNVLRAYDIRFLFRFLYTDNRNVPATLSIDEICEQ
ncbi:hypothetical protein [Gilliamella sp. wkB112]|uniref:hypothetical protein n=1 Tax=Gilliamella sp. wkB112 TaxID=3120257 RepID=UPI00080EDFD6|nr:hypothetical protein [Gilliamella apicola]OCG02862.1 hypothetical protein A9G12_07970 [Gilliamella apicola]